ncbi:MAG: AzlC family ABC transporter permease, partial [Clostridia bacterium]
MKNNDDRQLNFVQGLKAGFPVGLGYFSVSIAFGILAVQNKLPIWAPIVTSMTNLSGTGQFAGFGMLFSGAGLFEILFTVLMLNIRYFLMGVTLAQKLPSNIGFGKRMLIAFGLTDENFAIEISQKRELTFAFICGIILSSWCGWVSGTAVGALLNELVPAMLTSAMGIMLYAMFMAIFVPEARKSKAVLVVVMISLGLSSCFKWIPWVNKMPN